MLQVGGREKEGNGVANVGGYALLHSVRLNMSTYCCVYRCHPDAQVEHNMAHGPRGWRLLTLYAELKAGDSGADAKTLPDFESAGACWVSAEELKGLPLR